MIYSGMILKNAISRGRPLMDAKALDALMRSGREYTLIDARETEQYSDAHIESAKAYRTRN